MRRIPEYLLFTKNSFDRYYLHSFRTIRKGEITTIHDQQIKIDLRRNSSDFLVFDQIFIEEGLRPIIQLIKDKNIPIKNILDCGANIGLTALYLSRHLSNVNILALEPEPDNYKQLLTNIEQNKLVNTKAIQIGVWSKKALLEHDVNFCYAKGWAFSVRESENEKGSISVDTIESITRTNNFSSVDYLKMDIEGSEFELFRNLNTWKSVLDNAKVITIEIHEKKGGVLEIEDILRRHNFEINKFGELLTGWKI